MKDVSLLIMLIVGVIFALLFFNEKSKRNPSAIIRDTIWVMDTIRPKQPKPVIIPGERDTITAIDWAVMDSIKKIYGDSIASYLAEKFNLVYEDTLQKMSVKVSPLLKSALFSPFYKPIRFMRPEIKETQIIQKRSWFEAYLGAGYRKADSSQVYFFLDANFNVSDNFTFTSRLSNEAIGAELRYKIY